MGNLLFLLLQWTLDLRKISSCKFTYIFKTIFSDDRFFDSVLKFRKYKNTLFYNFQEPARLDDFLADEPDENENDEENPSNEQDIEITKSTGGNAGKDESKPEESDDKDNLDQEDILKEDQDNEKNQGKDNFPNEDQKDNKEDNKDGVVVAENDEKLDEKEADKQVLF